MELVEIKNNNILIDVNAIEKIKEFEKKYLEMELIKKELRLMLKNAFEITGKKEILLDGFRASYTKPTTRTTIDSKRLKAELPDIFEEYSKTIEVAGSVTIKVE